MRLTNIGFNYANCTARCRPNAFNRTVVHKSNLSPDACHPKTGNEQVSGPRPCVYTPWSSAPASNGELLKAKGPRNFSTRFASTDASSANLYEVLGVNPKATHKEIKAAYYTLSMTYHPDKNRDSDTAALKFREITAAYEVLGNFLSRKNYDRSIMAGGISSGAVPREESTIYESSRGKHYRSQVSVHRGRTTIYNFDEWTREHYGDTIARTASRRAEYRRWKQKMQDHEGEKHVEIMMTVITLIVVAFLMFPRMLSYDHPLPVTNGGDAKS